MIRVVETGKTRTAIMLLTNTMVDVPVMAKTAQMRNISAYQRGVFRGGISLGAIHRCRNVLAPLCSCCGVSFFP